MAKYLIEFSGQGNLDVFILIDIAPGPGAANETLDKIRIGVHNLTRQWDHELFSGSISEELHTHSKINGVPLIHIKADMPARLTVCIGTLVPFEETVVHSGLQNERILFAAAGLAGVASGV